MSSFGIGIAIGITTGFGIGLFVASIVFGSEDQACDVCHGSGCCIDERARGHRPRTRWCPACPLGRRMARECGAA